MAHYSALPTVQEGTYMDDSSSEDEGILQPHVGMAMRRKHEGDAGAGTGSSASGTRSLEGGMGGATSSDGSGRSGAGDDGRGAGAGGGDMSVAGPLRGIDLSLRFEDQNEVTQLQKQVEKWLELTKDDQTRLLRDIRESQSKLSEQVRMSQALVHFQADEAFNGKQGSGESLFLTEIQTADGAHMRERFDRREKEKRMRLQMKLEAKRLRQNLKLREQEVEHLLITRHKSAVFHRRLDFMRAQHQQVLDHTQERHKKEARELLEAQEVESRHLRMSQELQARQLPKEVQGTFLQICEVASRQLRESQNTRARQLVELQVLEMAHSTANFERGLKMAEDRHTLEASHSQQLADLRTRHAAELLEEGLRIQSRQADLKMLQLREILLMEERQMKQQQRARQIHLELRQRRAERFRRKLWRQNAALSYAEFLSSLRQEENTVARVFSEDGSSVGTGHSGSIRSGASGQTPGTGVSDRSAEEYERKLKALRAEEDRLAQERSRRDEQERKSIIDTQRTELETAISEDTKRLEGVRSRQGAEVSTLQMMQQREKEKLIKRWKGLDAEAKTEQAKQLSALRFRHAALITELEEAQVRELEHFKKTFELQSQLQGAESRGKLDFLSFVCHEIRNPLAGVCGLVELLLGGDVGGTPINDEVKKFLEDVSSETALMRNILDDVLDISKLEAGKLDIEPRIFDPYAMLERIVESRAAAMSGQHKPVDMFLESSRGEPVRAWCSDPLRYNQICNNLVSNACKFCTTGYVKVTLGVVPGAGLRPMLRTMVEDTGCGIPADAISRLFVPFSQAKPSVVRKYGGTGLGLCICKMLVERMGGSIEVRSEAGRGSVFWVDLPMLSQYEGDGDDAVEMTPGDSDFEGGGGDDGGGGQNGGMNGGAASPGSGSAGGGSRGHGPGSGGGGGGFGPAGASGASRDDDGAGSRRSHGSRRNGGGGGGQVRGVGSSSVSSHASKRSVSSTGTGGRGGQQQAQAGLALQGLRGASEPPAGRDSPHAAGSISAASTSTGASSKRGGGAPRVPSSPVAAAGLAPVPIPGPDALMAAAGAALPSPASGAVGPALHPGTVEAALKLAPASAGGKPPRAPGAGAAADSSAGATSAAAAAPGQGKGAGADGVSSDSSSGLAMGGGSVLDHQPSRLAAAGWGAAFKAASKRGGKKEGRRERSRTRSREQALRAMLAAGSDLSLDPSSGLVASRRQASARLNSNAASTSSGDSTSPDTDDEAEEDGEDGSSTDTRSTGTVERSLHVAAADRSSKLQGTGAHAADACLPDARSGAQGAPAGSAAAAASGPVSAESVPAAAAGAAGKAGKGGRQGVRIKEAEGAEAPTPAGATAAPSSSSSSVRATEDLGRGHGSGSRGYITGSRSRKVPPASSSSESAGGEGHGGKGSARPSPLVGKPATRAAAALAAALPASGLTAASIDRKTNELFQEMMMASSSSKRPGGSSPQMQPMGGSRGGAGAGAGFIGSPSASARFESPVASALSGRGAGGSDRPSVAPINLGAGAGAVNTAGYGGGGMGAGLWPTAPGTASPAAPASAVPAPAARPATRRHTATSSGAASASASSNLPRGTDLFFAPQAYGRGLAPSWDGKEEPQEQARGSAGRKVPSTGAGASPTRRPRQYSVDSAELSSQQTPLASAVEDSFLNPMPGALGPRPGSASAAAGGHGGGGGGFAVDMGVMLTPPQHGALQQQQHGARHSAGVEPIAEEPPVPAGARRILAADPALAAGGPLPLQSPPQAASRARGAGPAVSLTAPPMFAGALGVASGDAGDGQMALTPRPAEEKPAGVAEHPSDSGGSGSDEASYSAEGSSAFSLPVSHRQPVPPPSVSVLAVGRRRGRDAGAAAGNSSTQVPASGFTGREFTQLALIPESQSETSSMARSGDSPYGTTESSRTHSPSRSQPSSDRSPNPTGLAAPATGNGGGGNMPSNRSDGSAAARARGSVQGSSTVGSASSQGSAGDSVGSTTAGSRGSSRTTPDPHRLPRGGRRARSGSVGSGGSKSSGVSSSGSTLAAAMDAVEPGINVTAPLPISAAVAAQAAATGLGPSDEPAGAGVVVVAPSSGTPKSAASQRSTGPALRSPAGSQPQARGTPATGMAAASLPASGGQSVASKPSVHVPLPRSVGSSSVVSAGSASDSSSGARVTAGSYGGNVSVGTSTPSGSDVGRRIVGDEDEEEDRGTPVHRTSSRRPYPARASRGGRSGIHMAHPAPPLPEGGSGEEDAPTGENEDASDAGDSVSVARPGGEDSDEEADEDGHGGPGNDSRTPRFSQQQHGHGHGSHEGSGSSSVMSPTSPRSCSVSVSASDFDSASAYSRQQGNYYVSMHGSRMGLRTDAMDISDMAMGSMGLDGSATLQGLADQAVAKAGRATASAAGEGEGSRRLRGSDRKPVAAEQPAAPAHLVSPPGPGGATAYRRLQQASPGAALGLEGGGGGGDDRPRDSAAPHRGAAGSAPRSHPRSGKTERGPHSEGRRPVGSPRVGPDSPVAARHRTATESAAQRAVADASAMLPPHVAPPSDGSPFAAVTSAVSQPHRGSAAPEPGHVLPPASSVAIGGAAATPQRQQQQPRQGVPAFAALERPLVAAAVPPHMQTSDDSGGSEEELRAASAGRGSDRDGGAGGGSGMRLSARQVADIEHMEQTSVEHPTQRPRTAQSHASSSHASSASRAGSDAGSASSAGSVVGGSPAANLRITFNPQNQSVTVGFTPSPAPAPAAHAAPFSEEAGSGAGAAAASSGAGAAPASATPGRLSAPVGTSSGNGVAYLSPASASFRAAEGGGAHSPAGGRASSSVSSGSSVAGSSVYGAVSSSTTRRQSFGASSTSSGATNSALPSRVGLPAAGSPVVGGAGGAAGAGGEKKTLPPSLRVLIAEDSTTLQKLYVYNFSREGIEPVIANNGREAVELASSRPFDVMLLDVLMPEVSGDEALRVMRRRGIRTPAFMVTANVLPSQRDEYLRAGANAVLRKPWTFSAIREAIIDALAAPPDFGDRDGGVSRQSSGTGSASGRKHSSSRSISGRSVGTAGGSVAGTGSGGTIAGTPGGSRARGHVPSSAGSVASRSSKASKGSAGGDTARGRHDVRDLEATGPPATFRA